jgi:hypothetical protein
MEKNTEVIQLSDFFRLLSGRNILNIAEPDWRLTRICHGVGCKDHYDAKEYRDIRLKFKHLRKIGGLYAYYVKGRCIYIGVSKDLAERIYQHLLESCDVWGHDRYRAVFIKYPGLIDFYYLPLGDQSCEGDYLRSIVEKVLQVKHDPELKSLKI